MRLYLLRHAPAVSRDAWDGPDELRPLSADGEALARAVAVRLHGLRLCIDVAVTSPHERASRTAVLVCEALGGTVPLIEDRRLTPAWFTPATLADMLLEHRQADAVLLVGHEPSMTEVLAYTVGGGRFNLKKGGLARVDLDPEAPRSGVLKLLATPGLLR